MAEEHECPSCDYTTDSQHGVAIHHYHAHGESIAKSTYECDVCGESFERYDCNMRGDDTFCSRECKDDHFRQLDSEERPRWKGGEVTVECEWCGDETVVARNRARQSERLFCSPECTGKWKSENLAGENHPLFGSVEVECDWCGESTYKLEGRIERSKRDFCSHECHNKWMSEYQTGTNHHHWTGGRRDYGVGWNEQKREAVRERDNRECHDCGMSQERSIAEFGRKLDVHHLVVPGSDTNPAVHNAKRNLVTLCVSCHHKREMNSELASPVQTAMEVCES